MSWHFTKYGFFSSVCARKDGGKGEVDPTRRMVRVRSLQHLANLRVRFPVEMEMHEVHTSSSADYPARVILPTAVWVSMVTAMEEEVDYDNFKGAVAKAKLTEPDYENALHRVWSVMRSFQDALSRLSVVTKLRRMKLRPKRASDLGPGETSEQHEARVRPQGVIGAEVVAIVSIRLELGEADAIPAALVLGAASRDDRTLLADLVVSGMMGDIEPDRVRVDRVPWSRVDERLHELPIFDLLYEGSPS